MQLIRYLTDREAQANYPVQIDHLPVRQEVLDQPPFSTDTILSGFVRMADTARPFPTIKMGGLLQTLYCTSIARLWAHIASEPELDLKDAIQDEIKMLSRRIETWFE